MSGVTLKEVGGDLVVDVTQESTVIGRGQFLQVTDKRVSRSHALLELKDGQLYITPTHTNPCFLRSETSQEQTVLTRDVKHLLSNGDEFGLLPDQLFYKVRYPHINGKQSETMGEPEEEKKAVQQEEKDEAVSNGGSDITPFKPGGDVKVDKEDGETETAKSLPEKAEKTEGKEEKINQRQEVEAQKEEEEESKTTGKNDEEEEDEEEEKEESDMAMPVDKKRVLPAWMVQAANQESPMKAKAAPAKTISEAVNKRPPGTKITKPEPEEDDDDDEDIEDDDDDDEEYTPKKRGKSRLNKLSDDDYEEDASDDDYTPEKRAPRNQRGRGRKKKRASDSEDDDFSDEDDDYSPRKAKTKKAAKGRGKRKTPSKKGPARGARTTTPRSRTKRKVADDDEDDDDEILPRRRGDLDDEEDVPSRRPQRAAKQKRGSYVDDPLIEEALEDFASEEEVVEDKDSDFEVEGMEDSGSDWEKSAATSHKQKAGRVRGKASLKAVGKRSVGKRKARRPSKPMNSDDDDDDDDDIMEDDEPYVPRPSKRRGGLMSQDGEDSDEDARKKRRRREECQYGKKCYRKNPVHFRTYCHPGDSSYGEEDEEDPAMRDSSSPKKDREASKASPSKPSRPQRSTAGTKLVTQGADDDLPDTYDYQDSFIDDGTQHSAEEEEADDAEDDSDYDAEEDIRGLAKEAKAFVRGKKN